MIKAVTYIGEKDGNSLLILGSIHGDEKCGTRAIVKIISDLDSGRIKIQTGQITLIPICNPKAYEADKRYYEVNLNRIFKKHANPEKYEEKLANVLTAYVENNDYLLDLHSMAANGVPCIFEDYMDKKTQEWVKKIGPKHIIRGRPQMYKETESSDSLGYAHNSGKTGVVIECGTHNEYQAEIVAYKAIKNTLSHLGFIESKCEDRSDGKFDIIECKKIIFKQKAGKYVKKFEHLDFFKKGEKIAEYIDGEEINMEKDGYILLPNEHSKQGEERFYIGEKSE